MIHMVPGENSIPNIFLFDKYALELLFLTIYGVQYRTY